jgi:hypothetical protein
MIELAKTKSTYLIVSNFHVSSFCSAFIIILRGSRGEKNDYFSFLEEGESKEGDYFKII